MTLKTHLEKAIELLGVQPGTITLRHEIGKYLKELQPTPNKKHCEECGLLFAFFKTRGPDERKYCTPRCRNTAQVRRHRSRRPITP